jgi:hypothetical protein
MMCFFNLDLDVDDDVAETSCLIAEPAGPLVIAS